MNLRCLHNASRLAAATLGALLALGAALAPDTARAGVIVTESIASRGDAIDDARRLLPAGAVITQTDCTEMIRDLSPRYRCTVQWVPAVP